MSNCTGVICGKVTAGGKPAAGFEVSLNWILREGGGQTLTVGGTDDLITCVRKVNTAPGWRVYHALFLVIGLGSGLAWLSSGNSVRG